MFWFRLSIGPQSYVILVTVRAWIGFEYFLRSDFELSNCKNTYKTSKNLNEISQVCFYCVKCIKDSIKVWIRQQRVYSRERYSHKVAFTNIPFSCRQLRKTTQSAEKFSLLCISFWSHVPDSITQTQKPHFWCQNSRAIPKYRLSTQNNPITKLRLQHFETKQTFLVKRAHWKRHNWRTTGCSIAQFPLRL